MLKKIWNYFFPPRLTTEEWRKDPMVGDICWTRGEPIGKVKFEIMAIGVNGRVKIRSAYWKNYPEDQGAQMWRDIQGLKFHSR